MDLRRRRFRDFRWLADGAQRDPVRGGATNGIVYFLSVASGEPSKQFSAGSPVVGVASSQDFATVTTAAGLALAYKYAVGAFWRYAAPAGFNSAATIREGIVYLAGLDQTVRAVAIPGQQIP